MRVVTTSRAFQIRQCSCRFSLRTVTKPPGIAWGLVDAMQKYLPIDTYGKCGTKTCPKRAKECADLPTRFKFNLAFENSQCPEYITEKFWANALMQGVVPVVFGAPREDYLRLAPPKSYIWSQGLRFCAGVCRTSSRNSIATELYTPSTSNGENWAPSKKEALRPCCNSRYHSTVNLCYIMRILIDKFCHPSKYPWQRRNPIFYDWWTGKCKPKEYVMGENLKTH